MAGTRPVKTMRHRGLSVAIWKFQRSGYEDFSITFEKSYKDAESDTWKTTGYVSTDELPQMIQLLTRAYAWIAHTKEKTSSHQSRTESVATDEPTDAPF